MQQAEPTAGDGVAVDARAQQRARRTDDVLDLRNGEAVLVLADSGPSAADLDPDELAALIAACPAEPRRPRLTRLLDLAVGVPALALAVPVLGVIAALITITNSGPAFYASERRARHGGTFGAWKLRTMVDEQAQQRILEMNPGLAEQLQRECKLTDDPRVTRIGRLLRRTSLDELPQLWNIVKGDMSLVGPRPKTMQEDYRYGDALDPILTVRPGLTGRWQVSGRNDLPFVDRIVLDLEYVANRSLRSDLAICAATVRQLLSKDRHGAY